MNDDKNFAYKRSNKRSKNAYSKKRARKALFGRWKALIKKLTEIKLTVFSYNYYITDSGKYDVYDGDCSGGVIQKQSADLANDEKRVHTDGGCEKICLNDPICTGFSFTIPFNDAEECWTYSTRQAKGDGALNKRCYMKKCKNNSFVFCNTLAALIRLVKIWILHTFLSLVTWQQIEISEK